MSYYDLYKRDSTGKLIIFAFEGNKTKPIVNATVTITGNGYNIALQTNQSGQTEAVSLPATKPYSVYSVSVMANGYNPIKIDGAQVIPNITGIQEVEMIPSVQRSNYRPIQEIKIPPHPLAEPSNYPQKIDENPLTIPDPPIHHGYSSLPVGVLIPEYIIVHDGAPDDRNAPNYRVKFTDYITKVACGEIYADWHEEALKANILCIISFTLNRMFTQTYQGFDITSKTRWDHIYNHHQTTYPKIIKVVDSLFNQYIKHPDQNLLQPFLAEYRAHGGNCKLSQFGSEELAKQKYNHLNILKHYYEKCYKPIEIKTSDGLIFEGRPVSPPSEILKEDSSGSDVKEIQVYLNEIARKYTAIPKNQVDGKFGKTTTQAVKAFQKIFFLEESGVIDFTTWYKITNLYYSILDYRKSSKYKARKYSLSVPNKTSTVPLLLAPNYFIYPDLSQTQTMYWYCPYYRFYYPNYEMR